MPIYEYRCQSCNHEFESMQKFSDPLLTDCPACGQATLTKLVSAGGFQLKGTGWYATDFKGGSKKSAASETKSDTKSETKSDAKSETGTASPTETKKTGCGSGGCGHNH